MNKAHRITTQDQTSKSDRNQDQIDMKLLHKGKTCLLSNNKWDNQVITQLS